MARTVPVSTVIRRRNFTVRSSEVYAMPCGRVDWTAQPAAESRWVAKVPASTENCPVQRTLDVVGEKWTLLILRDAVNGVRRFDDFHRHIGLSEAVLSDRLRKLIAADVMKTVPYQEPGSRSRNEYRLTRKG